MGAKTEDGNTHPAELEGAKLIRKLLE
jgi:hypothetical protein